MSFTLLGVLGSGSSRLSCHHRLPLAAYQATQRVVESLLEAGSILVLWDYTRLGEDSRKFILLLGAQSHHQQRFPHRGNRGSAVPSSSSPRPLLLAASARAIWNVRMGSMCWASGRTTGA